MSTSDTLPHPHSVSSSSSSTAEPGFTAPNADRSNLIELKPQPQQQPRQHPRPYHTQSFPNIHVQNTNKRPAWHLTWAHRRHKYLRPFTRPIITIPSLNIWITLGELLFWTLYTAVIAAALAALIVSFVSTRNTADGGKRDEDRITNDSANKVGTLGTFMMLLTLLPTTHTSILTYLLNLPFERGIPYHRWLAYTSILVLAVHGALYIWFYTNATLFPTGVAANLFDGIGQVNLSGFVSLCCAVALAVTSLPFLRRHLFEFFYRLHIPLFIAFVVGGAVHQGQVIGILALPLVLYVVDIYFRVRNARKETKVESFRLLSDGVVRIE
ncbi:hypothetical protein HDV00_004741, partial [Rhizophlyctis rosea]